MVYGAAEVYEARATEPALESSVLLSATSEPVLSADPHGATGLVGGPVVRGLVG